MELPPTHQGSVIDQMHLAAKEPGEWRLVGTYSKSRTASAVASSLRRNERCRSRPEGNWRFRATKLTAERYGVFAHYEPSDGGETPTLEAHGVAVTIMPGASLDGSVVVWVDTKIAPDGADGGPGVRIWLNEEKVYEGVARVRCGVDCESGVIHPAMVGGDASRHWIVACRQCNVYDSNGEAADALLRRLGKDWTWEAAPLETRLCAWCLEPVHEQSPTRWVHTENGLPRCAHGQGAAQPGSGSFPHLVKTPS